MTRPHAAGKTHRHTHTHRHPHMQQIIYAFSEWIASTTTLTIRQKKKGGRRTYQSTRIILNCMK